MSEAEAAKARGNAAFQSGQLDVAIREFSAAIELEPLNAVYWSNRSMCHATKGDFELALQDGLKCVELKPDWAKAYSRAGLALFKLDRIEDATNMYQQGLEKCGKDAGLESGLAECQRAAEERKNPFAQLFGPDMWTKLALNPTTRALIEKPSVRQKLTMLQRNPQLIQAFMQDREVAPAIGVLLGLPFDAFAGGAGGGAGGADDMEAEAQPPAHGAPPRREPEAPKPEPARAPEPELSEEEKAARARKEEAGRLKAAGNDLFAQKQFQEALDLYTKAMELDPTDATHRSNRAAAYFSLGDYDKCLAESKEAVQVGQENMADFKLIAKIYTRMGHAHRKLNNVDEAIVCYEKSLLEHKDDATRKLVQQLRKTREEEKARAYLNPELSEKHKEEGNRLAAENKWAPAIAEYTEALKRDPNNFKALSNRAHAYTKLMQWQQAMDDCNECLRQQPTFVKAFVRKAKIQIFLKQYHKALETCEAGLKLPGEEHNAELKQLQMETAMGIQSANASGEGNEQRAQEALKDPEIQSIVTDPIIQQVLRDFKESPATAQKAMLNPDVRRKINKLVAAGVLRVG